MARTRNSFWLRAAGALCAVALLGNSLAARAEDPELSGSAELLTLGSAAGLVSADELESNRAKARLEIDKVFINDQELNGSVSGNVAVNTRSGANVITDAAFSDASGIINSIQNTGNNVLIQSATIVNVSIEE